MGVDIAYQKYFALETTDFAPVVSAMLAVNPDVLDLTCTYPGWATLLIEQAYLQGFNGYISHNNIDLEATLVKVPAEWLAGLIDSYPEFDDPWWGEPSEQHDFYNKWMARYGPGAPGDLYRAITPIDWLYTIGMQVWIAGVEAAGTFDAEAVIEAAKAQEEIPSWLGPITWPETEKQEEIFGIDNLYQPPIHVCEIQPDGLRRIIDVQDFWGWYDEYGDILLRHCEEEGVLWWQR